MLGNASLINSTNPISKSVDIVYILKLILSSLVNFLLNEIRIYLYEFCEIFTWKYITTINLQNFFVIRKIPSIYKWC